MTSIFNGEFPPKQDLNSNQNKEPHLGFERYIYPTPRSLPSPLMCVIHPGGSLYANTWRLEVKTGRFRGRGGKRRSGNDVSGLVMF